MTVRFGRLRMALVAGVVALAAAGYAQAPERTSRAGPQAGCAAAGAPAIPCRPRAPAARQAGRPRGGGRSGGTAGRRARPRLWRLPARLFPHRFCRGDQPGRREERPPRHDAARRTLCQRVRHPPGRCQGGGMVPPRGRTRRPRCHVRPCPVQHDRARRPARPRPRRRACSPRRPSSAMRRRPMISACSISKASNFLRISAAPRSCSGPPPRPATRRPNTRSPRSTRTAAASRRTRPKRRGCWRRRRSRRIRMPRSNTPLPCTTAPASPRTRPGDRAVPPRRAARQPDRPEPPGPHLHHRPRRRRQSGRGDQMAPHRQGRRQQRSLSRQICRRPNAARSARPRRRRRVPGSPRCRPNPDRSRIGCLLAALSPAWACLDAAGCAMHTTGATCALPRLKRPITPCCAPPSSTS